MATISLLLPLLLLILSLNITTSSAAPLLLNAAEILSDSGHLSMSLTLQLIHQPPLLSQSPSTTIFAPSNAAFLKSGQPSLNQLHYQISPIYFSLKTIKSLPINTKLPTLFSNHSLTITSSPFDSRLSINNIPINDSTLFDDKKSLIIFSVDSFFDYSPQIPPNFEADLVEITKPPVQAPDPGHRDTLILRHPFDVYARASNLLRLRGYNRMATFLDMQLVGVVGELKLTVFAPADWEIDEFVRGNFSDYSWVFMQHVVPQWLSFAELTRVYDGTLLQTFSERFKVEVTRSGEDGVVEINGVPIVFPDMFYSDWLVVHGLQSSLLDT